MMRRISTLLLGVLLLGTPFTASALVFYWTGIGNGWKDQVPPPNDGTADLVFGNSVVQVVPLGATFSVNSLTFEQDDAFRFVPSAGSSLLTIANGMAYTSVFSSRVDFDGNVTVNLSSSQTWDMGSFGSATLHGKLTGSGNLTVTGEGATLLLANLTASPTDYTGNIIFTSSPSAAIGTRPSLVLWGGNSLGSGALFFENGGTLVTHYGPTITNAITLNSGSLPGGQLNYSSLIVNTWDDSTTLAGPITLANNTIIQSNVRYLTKVDSTAPNSTGSRPLPGPFTRYPLVISGNIGESGGSRSLNITGPGITVLAGTNNTYTGGTNVGFALNPAATVPSNSNGSLIFASQSAIPASGTIQVGLANSASATGYLGIATSAFAGQGPFTNYLTGISATSTGSVGVDSLTGNVPSALPDTFSLDFDLTHFTFTTAGYNGIRLGTATSVILTGAITPQLPTVYHFGNGGGRLFLQSNLANQPAATTSLQTTNGGVALQLYLQGSNSYTGGTFANSGMIIFDGPSALPATGTIRAGGSAGSLGASYLGFTDTIFGGSTLNNANLTSLFSRFDKPNSWGIIGFDTHFDAATGTANSPLTVSGLDLTGFNDGVFIGTSSKATISGPIGLTSVGTSNAANTLRLTAATGGQLTVTSDLVDGASPLSVVIGVPSGFQKMSDGTVILAPATGNTYTGGTTINSFGYITVAAGSNNAFGTGAITLSANAGGLVGLAASAPGLIIPNAITFAQAAPNTGNTPQLFLTGANGFTLSGAISGPPASNELITGVGTIMLVNPTPINVTLSGDNSGYFGLFYAGNGTLTFDHNNAAGRGTIQFGSSAATVAFNASNTVSTQNPVIYGIYADNGGNLVLPDGTNLTINTDKVDGDYEFGGVISGPGATSTTASLTIDATINPGIGNDLVYLYGHNLYTGGTYITGQAALALGASDSAGTGLITIDAADGGLVLNTGVTLTNPIQLNTGGLAGLGTFAPSAFNDVIGGPITIGANQVVLPGIPGNGMMPGTLTLAGNVAFADAGEYRWVLQDSASVEGSGMLSITGNLDLTSISATPFMLALESVDASGGGTGWNPTIAWGTNYQFTLVQTTGTITGFNPANFTFDVSKFQNGQIDVSNFSVTADSTHLYLNFAAVPEPSTWALLVAGSGVLGLARWRRRRD